MKRIRRIQAIVLAAVMMLLARTGAEEKGAKVLSSLLLSETGLYKLVCT
jgi:hypothetical protein